jgi:hypothetical protein
VRRHRDIREETTDAASAFEVHTYRSKKGLKTCGMFSRQFARVERERRLLRLFVEAPLKK